MVLLAIVSEGYLFGKLPIWERLLFAACVLGLLLGGWQFDLVALPVAAALIVVRYLHHKKVKTA